MLIIDNNSNEHRTPNTQVGLGRMCCKWSSFQIMLMTIFEYLLENKMFNNVRFSPLQRLHLIQWTKLCSIENAILQFEDLKDQQHDRSAVIQYSNVNVDHPKWQSFLMLFCVAIFNHLSDRMRRICWLSSLFAILFEPLIKWFMFLLMTTICYLHSELISFADGLFGIYQMQCWICLWLKTADKRIEHIPHINIQTYLDLLV